MGKFKVGDYVRTERLGGVRMLVTCTDDTSGISGVDKVYCKYWCGSVGKWKEENFPESHLISADESADEELRSKIQGLVEEESLESLKKYVEKLMTASSFGPRPDAAAQC